MPASDSFPITQIPPEPRPERGMLSGVLVSVSIHTIVLGALCLATFRNGAVPAVPRTNGAISIRLITDPVPDAQAPARVQPEPSSLAERRSIPAVAKPLPIMVPTAPSPAAPSGVTSPMLALAPASTRTAADPTAGDNYRQRLLDHISAFRHQPSLSPGERSDGTAMVRFSLTRGGDVIAVSLAASSGVSDLDDAAIATIWRARPMPAIPTSLPDTLTITLPVTFTSGRGVAAG